MEGDLFVSARWLGPQDQRVTNLYDSSEILVKVKIKRIRKSEGWKVRRTQGVQQVAALGDKDTANWGTIRPGIADGDGRNERRIRLDKRLS